MEQHQKLQISLEFIAWLATAIIVFLVIRPIVNVLTEYPFLWVNIAYIVVFITYTRYLFLWQYTLFPNSNIVRILILLAAIPMVFAMIQGINGFQTYLDDGGREAFMNFLKKPKNIDQENNLLNYIRSQFLFFGTGAVIVGILLPIRMIVSLWRSRNRGTV